MRKFLLLLLFALLLLNLGAEAQTYAGYNTGNYTGVNGVFFNPGNVVASPYRWSVNLVAFNTNVSNDYATLSFNGIVRAVRGDSLTVNDIKHINLSHTNFLVNVDAFGPSAMFNLDHRNSFAITTRVRGIANVDKLPGNLLNSFESRPEVSTFPSSINTQNARVTELEWAEFGITYGRVIIDKKVNVLKGGITLKYLAGIGAGYFNFDMNSKLNKDADGNPYLQNGVGQLSYGASGAADINDPQFKIDGQGVGGDLGLVYEYRPEKVMANANNLYRFKVSIALHDVGKIQYTHGPTDAGYTLNTQLNGSLDSLRLSRFAGISTLNELSNAIKSAGSVTYQITQPKGKYSYTLPGSLAGAIDYLIIPKLYVNLGGQLSLSNNSSNAQKTHTENYVVFTPRFETRHLTVSLPLSDNNISGFNAGFSISAGPIFLGSASIISTLINGQTKQADIHFGIIINGLRRRPNEKKEVEVPRASVFGPKPVVIVPIKRMDSDSDGVVDSLDKCPTIPGLAKYDGCPIPDSDSDGVNDEADKCPTIPGLAKYNGCPIPDSDSDGVNDEADKCPTIPGTAKYNGCPIPDSDSDGVNDELDKCPTLAGPASNNGCPVIKKSIVQKTNAAAKGVQFQRGKSIIVKSSYAKLNTVVQVLQTNPSLNIDIAGYTDNSGDPAKNEKLSTDRANAVKAYFVKKGIADNRISAEGYGNESPIAPNTTAQGRAKNRRVVLTLKNY